MRRAVEVLLGVASAFSSGKLDRVWFDAIARDEGEVDDLEFNTNMARKEAAVLRRYGMG